MSPRPSKTAASLRLAMQKSDRQRSNNDILNHRDDPIDLIDPICESDNECFPFPVPESTSLTFPPSPAAPTSSHTHTTSGVTTSSEGPTESGPDGRITTSSWGFQSTSQTSAEMLPTGTPSDNGQDKLNASTTRKAIGLGAGLGALALLLSIGIGIWLGVRYQRKRQSPRDKQERFEKAEADGKEIRKQFLVELPAEREPAELPDNSTPSSEDS